MAGKPLVSLRVTKFVHRKSLTSLAVVTATAIIDTAMTDKPVMA
jgi:hypothetical protein